MFRLNYISVTFLLSIFFVFNYVKANSEPVDFPDEYYVARIEFDTKDFPPGVEINRSIIGDGHEIYKIVNKSDTPFYLIGKEKFKDHYLNYGLNNFPNSELPSDITNKPLIKLVSSMVYHYRTVGDIVNWGWKEYDTPNVYQYIDSFLLTDMIDNFWVYEENFFAEGFNFSNKKIPAKDVVILGYYKNKENNISAKISYIPWNLSEKIVLKDELNFFQKINNWFQKIFDFIY